MTDLENLVPPHEPAEDFFVFAGKAALNLVPVVGPLAAETLAHALETRQAERQHEFNIAIAKSLTDAIVRLDGTATIEDVVGSDDFIAAVTRAQRAAAETASQQKRQRLAAAVANGGSWAPFSISEREQFTRLVGEFDELHIWLLHYFTDPAAWLQSRGLYDQHSNIMMGGISSPLGSALGVEERVWRSAVTQAIADIERAGLGAVPLTTTMGVDGIFAPRTSEKGRRFLAFINEPDSLAAEPPASL
ncbi:protein kinase family protein [Microterricola pindariensis]|uniref:Uncharacterized protein n=1 Tax=Microterricola pindariensis TaxID=478010 RepID=A0ABX5AY51_9MICO|nr:hypothetical protein [Microterricola pindariensis]PPL19810.1 hypothetical protein GY24_04115 [Microterricola pindariensis]